MVVFGKSLADALLQNRSRDSPESTLFCPFYSTFAKSSSSNEHAARNYPPRFDFLACTRTTPQFGRFGWFRSNAPLTETTILTRSHINWINACCRAKYLSLELFRSYWPFPFPSPSFYIHSFPDGASVFLFFRPCSFCHPGNACGTRMREEKFQSRGLHC